jgi:hypothetical protein
MKPCECEKELVVIEAARSAEWDAELQKHVAACQICADAMLAAQALNAMHAEDVAAARIPDAGLMWWKAQLLSKRAAAERATRPISFVEHLAYACGVFIFVVVCALQWGTIRGWFDSIRSGSAVRGAPATALHFDFYGWEMAFVRAIKDVSTFQRANLMLVLSVGVLSIFVALAVYLTRSEE